METSSLQEMFSVLPDQAVRNWPPSCSTKYVRAVRHGRRGMAVSVFIANCNLSFILPLRGVR